jgi:hypothetical protein
MSVASPAAPFPKILVCTDGSPDSEGAINAALLLAKTTGSAVFLLEVVFFLAGYELQSPDTLAPPVANLELMQVQEAAAKERLENWQTEAAGQGVTLTPRIRSGASAYDGILEEAGEIQPDLIIMGRHGYTGLTRLLMGSVTARVIGHSPADVLVVPRDTAIGWKTVLVATDGSRHSAAAAAKAVDLAASYGGRVVAVSVVDLPDEVYGVSPEAVEKIVGKARSYADAVAALAEKAGVQCVVAVREGQSAATIVQVAKEEGAGVIAMGSHGRTGLSRLLMGSVTEKVIGHAPCPVLVVR